MKSRAHIKSHPLHPILIAFPIAFLLGGVVADVAGRVMDWPRANSAGGLLSIAGVVMGLVAAVPGLIDYVSVVPRNSSAFKRATQHMVVNATALVLYALGAAFRDWDTMQPGWGTIVLEAAAVGLMGIGGWLGGTLVYRNQIGVDHRYAHAGKWREISLEGEAGASVVVDGAEEMKAGQMWLMHWGGRRLVLVRLDDGYAAFDDRCSHRGGTLADGALICGTVQCPWHGSQFDCRTGAVKAGPTEAPIETCQVELRDGKVRVRLPVRG